MTALAREVVLLRFAESEHTEVNKIFECCDAEKMVIDQIISLKRKDMWKLFSKQNRDIKYGIFERLYTCIEEFVCKFY